jgi:hypothetical protein
VQREDDFAPLPVRLTLAVCDSWQDISLVVLALAWFVVAASILRPGCVCRCILVLVSHATIVNCWYTRFANAAQDTVDTN